MNDFPMTLDRRLMLAGAAAFTLSTSAEAKGARPAIDSKTALIVVDVQNDFCTGGNLAVPKGEEVVPIINAMAKRFENVILTQDWHPNGHASFASQHAGKKPFDLITMPYGPQVLWPDHCIQGTKGAEFHSGLDIPHAQTIIRKGYRKPVDSYSGFMEADRKTRTGLGAYLKERGINQVVVVGLATDFCVNWTATDARKAGLTTYMVAEAARAINANGSLDKAMADMAKAGVRQIKISELPS